MFLDTMQLDQESIYKHFLSMLDFNEYVLFSSVDNLHNFQHINWDIYEWIPFWISFRMICAYCWGHNICYYRLCLLFELKWKHISVLTRRP